MLETRELVFRYPDGTEALRGVDVRIEEGELVALMGQNGSGKTTFARCLAGLLVPTAGEGARGGAAAPGGCTPGGTGTCTELPGTPGTAHSSPVWSYHPPP